jgi:hypothetical protein
MDSQGQSIETRIGTLSFTHDFANGYPTKETVEKSTTNAIFSAPARLTCGRCPSSRSPSGSMWPSPFLTSARRIYTDNKTKLARALDRDVSHRSALERTPEQVSRPNANREISRSESSGHTMAVGST